MQDCSKIYHSVRDDLHMTWRAVLRAMHRSSWHLYRLISRIGHLNRCKIHAVTFNEAWLEQCSGKLLSVRVMRPYAQPKCFGESMQCMSRICIRRSIHYLCKLPEL